MNSPSHSPKKAARSCTAEDWASAEKAIRIQKLNEQLAGALDRLQAMPWLNHPSEPCLAPEILAPDSQTKPVPAPRSLPDVISQAPIQQPSSLAAIPPSVDLSYNELSLPPYLVVSNENDKEEDKHSIYVAQCLLYLIRTRPRYR